MKNSFTIHKPHQYFAHAILCIFLISGGQAQSILDVEKANNSSFLESYMNSIYLPIPTAVGCTTEKTNEVLAWATSTSTSVNIDCNLTLSGHDVITKRLIFEGADATGVTCDCNGAKINGDKNTQNEGRDMIEVRSKKTGASSWIAPEYVFIKNCHIVGSVRIWGMGKNGEAPDIKESSRLESNNSKHVARVRSNAPRNIVFDNVTITGTHRNPLYFGPGVTQCMLINSEMKGRSGKVGIYFDAESAYNRIVNNYIHVSTSKDKWGRIPFIKNRGWPQIAIDGSSNNLIINNRFSSLNNGGIYFYRNCGEGGTIRHTPPECNKIINNSFYYNKYTGSKPTIYLGSRDYGFKERTFGHCGADRGRPYGSSKSDKDFARHNIIMQNMLFNRKVRFGIFLRKRKAALNDMIKTMNSSVNFPNNIDHNELVDQIIQRKAGCYVENSYKDFINHNESISVRINSQNIECDGLKQTCIDGKIEWSKETNCQITEIPFECRIEGNNNGCRTRVGCPMNQRIVGAKVACNLEFGAVDDGTLSSMSLNQIKVIVPANTISRSTCYINQESIRKGSKELKDIFDQIDAIVGCKEHDKNGGYCHVKGVLYCHGDL